MIHKKFWNFFGAILSDSQKTEIYLGQFSATLDDSWWCAQNWNLFGAILDDLQKTDIYFGWFSMILGDL